MGLDSIAKTLCKMQFRQRMYNLCYFIDPAAATFTATIITANAPPPIVPTRYFIDVNDPTLCVACVAGIVHKVQYVFLEI